MGCWIDAHLRARGSRWRQPRDRDSGQLYASCAIFPVGDLAGADPANEFWATRYIWDVGQISGAANSIAFIESVSDPDFAGQFFDTTSPVINHGSAGSDPPEDGVGAGLFGAGAGDGPGDLPYPDEVIDEGGGVDDFIQYNIGYIRIPSVGDYTFGVHSDDGFGLRIIGLPFTEFNAGWQVCTIPWPTRAHLLGVDLAESLEAKTQEAAIEN